MIAQMHPEDVKAAIRKRHGTVTAFEQREGLPAKSVNDLLRGRRSARVAAAIEALLIQAVPSAQSEQSDDSGEISTAHRLNPVAR